MTTRILTTLKHGTRSDAIFPLKEKCGVTRYCISVWNPTVKLLFHGQIMDQDQAQAKKKWDEACQHPGSEVERVFFPGGKTQRIQSKRKSNAYGCNHHTPTQGAFLRFWFR